MHDQRAHRLAIERRGGEIILVRDIGAQHAIQLILNECDVPIPLRLSTKDSVCMPLGCIHGVESLGEQFTGGVALEDSQLECPVLCRYDTGNQRAVICRTPCRITLDRPNRFLSFQSQKPVRRDIQFAANLEEGRRPG